MCIRDSPITLTEQQQTAYDTLLPKLEDAAPHSALLYGVTGSGKTLVFLKLISRCLELGRKALEMCIRDRLIAVGVVDLFNAAGRRTQKAQGQIRLLGRLLP